MPKSVYIDIGNSFTKIKSNRRITTIDNHFFSLPSFGVDCNILVSCVSNNLLKVLPEKVKILSAQKSYKSLLNGYENPTDLGIDRWLAMIAGYEIMKGGGFIVIDAGTAITIDIVDHECRHSGGYILPGIRKSLNDFMKFEYDLESASFLPGKNTAEAWTNGVSAMISYSLDGLVSENTKLNDYQVLLTGGDASIISKHITFPVHKYENLVLDGLEYYDKSMG